MHINEALIEACEQGNLNRVKELLGKGADPTMHESLSLKRALDRHSVIIAVELIRHGADIETVSRFGITAAFVAATDKETEILRELASLGADINSVDSGGETALIKVSRIGVVDSVLALIDLGVDVDFVSAKGVTAYSAATDCLKLAPDSERIRKVISILESHQDNKILDSHVGTNWDSDQLTF